MGAIFLSVSLPPVWSPAASRARSTLVHRRALQRAEREYGAHSDAASLARTAFRKELHATAVYAALLVATGIGLVAQTRNSIFALTLVLIPVGISFAFAKDFLRSVRLSTERFTIERRAE